jgi:translation initiation factor eIF-2B subunit beta
MGTFFSLLADDVGNANMRISQRRDVVLTMGNSTTVIAFLESAFKNRRVFDIILVDSAPLYAEKKTIEKLTRICQRMTIVSDACAYSAVPQANKVIVGAHAVLADGGILADAGTHMLALSSRSFSVPFVVCTGLYKLSPMYSVDQETFTEYRSPQEVIPREEGMR